MPFDDDNENLPQNKGLGKVSSKQSMIDKMSSTKQDQKNSFQESVDQAEERKSASVQTAQELAIAFNKLMADKTLQSNQDIFTSSIEKDVIKKLLQLSIDLNNDPNEKEGIGSTALFSIMLKNSISNRNRMNAMEYEIHQLKIQIKELKETKKHESD